MEAYRARRHQEEQHYQQQEEGALFIFKCTLLSLTIWGLVTYILKTLAVP